MPRLKNRKFETFNDGVLSIYEEEGRRLVLKKADQIRFGNKTVGIKRFWDAQVMSNQIDHLVSVLYVSGIERDNIVMIGERQFTITQVQEKFDAMPPCLYLSLESIQTPFKEEL